MVQDIITYGIVLYAAVYTFYHTAMIFIPKKDTAAKPGCSSCCGCSYGKECAG